MNHIVRPSSPRVQPLPPGERDAESRALIDSIGSNATDNTFDTLVRHPNLLRQWMPFTVALAVTGVLPPRLRELAILRTGWLCHAEYEWGQHAVLERFPIVHSTAVMVLLWRGGRNGTVLDGFADARAGRL